MATLSKVIAVDGPAAAGKGTVARRLAEHLGFAYLDTGLLYRAVGFKVIRAGADPGDSSVATGVAQTLSPDNLVQPGLRGDDVANAASKVAAIPSVRAALLDFQRQFSAAPPNAAAGAVLDGRDVGTIVCPDADLKLFITASLDVRAARRLNELRERGVEAIYSRVFRDMKERDTRDSERAIAPLEPAEDAVVIDTSNLSPDEVFAAVLKSCAAKGPFG